ncbi:hypothetical protein Tco_0893599 [Tanacetum coccineum]|uniref:Uncharacterized protein n=1 Tax=Tanacetum coccineum TaxID=301880 RepID=A0ABQ5CAU7_9ASTR
MVCVTDILSHSYAPNIIFSLPDDSGWRNVLFCHLTIEFFLFRVSTQAQIPLKLINNAKKNNIKNHKRTLYYNLNLPSNALRHISAMTHFWGCYIEGTESESNEEANLTGPMGESSKKKKMKKFDVVTEGGDHIYLIEEQIKEKMRIKE